MTNTAENLANSSDAEVEAIPVANVASRAIAALVDFLVISAFVSLGTKLIVTPGDPTPYISFVVGAIYFSLSHSRLLDGKTLGKRILGLSVVSTTDLPRKAPYLSIAQAFKRYLFTYGLLILLAELPFTIYREYSISGSSTLLEVNMLLVMGYTVANIFALLFHHNHQGLHDRIASSVVARGDIDFPNSVLESETDDEQRAQKIMPFIGLAIGALLWLPGVFQAAEISQIQSKRFVIEGELGVRTLSLQYQGKKFLLIYALLEQLEADQAGANLQELATRIDSIAFANQDTSTLAVRNYRFQYFDSEWNAHESNFSVPPAQDSPSADSAIMR